MAASFVPAYFKTPSGIPGQTVARRLAETIHPHVCVTDERERLPLRRDGRWQLDLGRLWTLREIPSQEPAWDYWEISFAQGDGTAADEAVEGLARFAEWTFAQRGPLA